jgi:hypothetical protein
MKQLIKLGILGVILYILFSSLIFTEYSVMRCRAIKGRSDSSIVVAAVKNLLFGILQKLFV